MVDVLMIAWTVVMDRLSVPAHVDIFSMWIKWVHLPADSLSPLEVALTSVFQKTCHRSNVCPYDFSFWLDGSDNACNDGAFDTLQREKSQLLMSFFTAYVRDDKAKMAAAFWAEDALTHSIGNYHTENTSIQFLKDQIQERIRLCSPAKNLFCASHYCTIVRP